MYKRQILTNASGSVNPDIIPGSIVNITDHINLHHDNPLRGLNNDTIGPRYPDMNGAYDISESAMINKIASRLELNIHNGVYLGLSGPNFETPAEYRMAKILGADIVGMSTIAEVLVANHCGLKVNALSIVSNQFVSAWPSKGAELEEVLEVVRKNTQRLLILITHTLEHLQQFYR